MQDSCQICKENEEGIVLKITRYWPKILYPCHQTSFHGCQMILVPAFSGGVINKQLWIIVSIITQVEDIWSLCTECIVNSNVWLGWVLTYITNKCLHLKKRQHPKDPFKLNQIKNINQIRSKIPGEYTTIHLLRTINKCHCIELINFSPEEIEAIAEDEENFETNSRATKNETRRRSP